MRQLHIGIAEYAGSLHLFAPPSASISNLEATMSVLSFLRTSLLDLAERKLGLFFWLTGTNSLRNFADLVSGSALPLCRALV